MWSVMCVFMICLLCCMPPDERWPDRLSHVTSPETGQRCAQTPPQRPHQSSENTVKKREETHRHRLTRYKGGPRQSHAITVCACLCVRVCVLALEPFRWKIRLPNQSLIESLSSGSSQSTAHNVPSPSNNGQSTAHNACRCHVDPDKM